jgi:hypothetical protein
MRSTKRFLVLAGLVAGATLVVAPMALAQVGNTDAAHARCAQGGGNGPVFGAHSHGDVGGIAALTDPNADHGAAGVLANNSNAGGNGEGGAAGGLGGSSLRGGGAGGCNGPSLPATGAPVARIALWGLTVGLLGVAASADRADAAERPHVTASALSGDSRAASRTPALKRIPSNVVQRDR